LQNMLEWFIIFAAKHFLLRLSLGWFFVPVSMGLMPRQMSWQLAGWKGHHLFGISRFYILLFRRT